MIPIANLSHRIRQPPPLPHFFCPVLDLLPLHTKKENLWNGQRHFVFSCSSNRNCPDTELLLKSAHRFVGVAWIHHPNGDTRRHHIGAAPHPVGQTPAAGGVDGHEKI